MLEPPANLTDATLGTALRDQYRLDLAALTFLPIGHDSSAWVYRADNVDGRSHFVKVRLRIDNEPGLRVPRHLHEQGVGSIVAPVPTSTGALWGNAGDHAVILYPFVAGDTGMVRGLADRQWREYGAILRQIHAVAVAPDLARRMRRERFSPEWGPMVRRIDAHIGEQEFASDAENDLAAFWRARRDEIRAILDHAEGLGRRLAAASRPFVLCHADIHTGNLMVGDDGRLWIVDWDETILAPPERDLMFAIGGISASFVGPRDEALFREGYGEAAIDPLALAYYRYTWAVGDIGSYAEEVFFRPDFGAITARASVESLKGLFAPGEIVSIATNSPLD